MPDKRKCANCPNDLDPEKGFGALPGKPDILVCRDCYRSITNQN